MANKIDCIEQTTLNSITLIKSSCELFAKELPLGTGRIVISLANELVDGFEVADKNNGFSILVKLNATGYVPDSDKKVFTSDCVISAKYDVISDIEIPIDAIDKSVPNFSKQLYPSARSIVVESMAKMGINGIDAPWDMSADLVPKEKVENIKTSSVKKKAVKKKVSKKKLKSR